ncbi:MAG: dockerin type I domain-containing protein [Candidatus Bathyarchaeota archaeon]
MQVGRRAALVLIALLVLAWAQFHLQLASAATYINVDPTVALMRNKLQIGFQPLYSSSNLNSRSDVLQLYKDLKPKIVRVFDWRPESERLDPCVRWYESSRSGSFDWRDVDRIIDMIFDMGAEPLICLGSSGSMYPASRYDSRYLPRGMTLQSNTLPAYDQFAAYCREWVEHFKETNRPVRYYEIWNEAHGYFDWGGEDTTRLRSWMDFWITCEREMHAENPDILIGNDQTNMKKVLEAFIDRDANLGFISYHKYDTGSRTTPDSEVFTAAETLRFQETSNDYGAKGAQERWYEAKRELIPIINSESNMNWGYSPTDPRLQKMSGAVWNALCLRKEVLEGVDYHVYFDEYSYTGWNGVPEGFGMVDWSREPKKWYPYYVYLWFGNHLAFGDMIIETSSSGNIRSLGWLGNNMMNILIIHKASYTETARIQGVQGEFKYYKIDESYSYTSPRMQEGTLDITKDIVLNGYTVMLLQREIGNGANRLFEDDLESGDFSAWSGLTTTDIDYAKVFLETSYSGSYGAVFTTLSSISETRRACAYITVEESQEIYARGYFKIATGLPLNDENDRFTLIQFLSLDESIICNLQVRRSTGADRFYILAGENMVTSGPPYPESDTWYCIEFFIKVHSTEGVLKAYVDNAEILSLRNVNTAVYGNVGIIRFGLTNSINVEHAVAVFGDNFVVSDGYIGPLFPWDINRDGIVDLRDMAIMSLAYRSTPESPNWNEAADLDRNGVVDMMDFALVARHFQEEYP